MLMGQWAYSLSGTWGAPIHQEQGRGAYHRHFLANHRNALNSLKTSHWHGMCNTLLNIYPSSKAPFLLLLFTNKGEGLFKAGWFL
jgi:hypothetical protein